ncbi:MAG: DUF4416 family protein [Deltaproteobacteria bacterium]|nr:DUF4416 family protein [Deltaproteobacteria bacterium]
MSGSSEKELERSHLWRVKVIAAILFSDLEELEKVKKSLEAVFSKIDYQSEPYPFVFSDYYQEEMGGGLKRVLLSFKKLAKPEFLAASKLITREFENNNSIQGKRKVNIDIGYLDLFKVVLASFKGRGNKLYLSQGVWADIVLYFESGDYETFLWGFPDFKEKTYNQDLIQIRKLYKNQLKNHTGPA